MDKNDLHTGDAAPDVTADLDGLDEGAVGDDEDTKGDGDEDGEEGQPDDENVTV